MTQKTLEDSTANGACAEIPRRWREAAWTHASIRDFWNFQATSPRSQQMSFAKGAGKGIVQVLLRSGHVRPQGEILDYGCGAGHLTPFLLEARFRVTGVDSSEDLVAMNERRFAGRPDWRGAVTSTRELPDESFDAIAFVEVIEHLLDADVQPVLADVRRLLRPGGVAIVTTPNCEPIGDSETCCPFCMTRFHYRQHLRSLSPETLKAMLSAAGFATEFCGGLDFHQLSFPGVRWKDYSLRRFARDLRLLRARVLDRLRPADPYDSREFRLLAHAGPTAPHLCAIAVK